MRKIKVGQSVFVLIKCMCVGLLHCICSLKIWYVKGLRIFSHVVYCLWAVKDKNQ